MAKDIKLIKDNSEIIINELNLEHYLKLGYKKIDQENKKLQKDKSQWQHIMEKKA